MAQIAAEVREQIEGLFVLDALGDDPQSHRMTEFDGGSDKLEVAFSVTGGKVALHAAHWARAWSSTQVVSNGMRRASSARGRNLRGGTKPSCFRSSSPAE